MIISISVFITFLCIKHTFGNPTQKTLFLFYDYFKADDGTPRDPNLNTKLVTGVENEVAFGGNFGNMPVSFAGSSTSVRLCPEVTSGCDENNVFTTENVLKYLENYTYVHVDEMRTDQTTCEEDCATVVRNVAAKGMGGRIIFYFRFSPTDTTGLKTQYDILQTAKEGMLRKIFFEVYKDGWITTSNVGNAKTLLNQWDSTYASVFPSSNLYIAPAIGLSNWATEGAYMDCCSQDMSALTTIYGGMHSTQPDWKGLSFYLASKCDDCWANACTVEPVGSGTRVYTRLTVVEKLNSLNSWWNGKGSNIATSIIPSMNLTKRSNSVVATAPIAFYYDYFNNRDPSTNSLATPNGVEPVFGGNCGNLAVPVYIPSSGGMSATSFRMKPNDWCTCTEECMSVENIINIFNMGIPYVHIDEVSYDHPCPECASIIQQVGDAGYAGRIIVFMRYSLSGIGLSDQTPIIDLAMKGYVRKLLFETYPSANSQCPSYLCTSTSGNAVQDLSTWANVIDSVYPGANAVFAPTFGLRAGIELDYCPNDLSAITSYFSAMHQYFPYWTGAAWFGAHECCSCSGYSYNDMAQKCAGLVSWWG